MYVHTVPPSEEGENMSNCGSFCSSRDQEPSLHFSCVPLSPLSLMAPLPALSPLNVWQDFAAFVSSAFTCEAPKNILKYE